MQPATSIEAAARVARDERPRRLRLGHDRRDPHAPLPRPARSPSLPNPAGRVMMLSALAEGVRLPDRTRADLGWVAPVFTHGEDLRLVEFSSSSGSRSGGSRARASCSSARLAMAYGHNTTVMTYRLIEGGPVRLELRPALQFRGSRRSRVGAGARGVSARRARCPDRARRAGSATEPAVPPRRADGDVRDRAALGARDRSTRSRRAAATNRAAQLYSPGRFRRISSTDETRRADRVDGTVGDDHDARVPTRRSRPRPSGASACCSTAPPGGAHGPGRGARARRRSVRDPPRGRHEDHVRARVDRRRGAGR